MENNIFDDKVAVIIDCANVGYAAAYGYAYMNTGDTPNGVIYGLLKCILNITDVCFPNYVIFAWDSAKSQRKRLYPLYKNKDKVDMSEEKMMAKQVTDHQLDLLRYEILPKIGFNNHCFHTGYEADDVMASIALQYNFDLCIIVSNDNDMYQCITDKVLVYNHKEHRLIDPLSFYQEHKVRPNQWARVKTLTGCTSDNVPGIKDVQEKTAVKYLHKELNKTSKVYKRIIKNKTRARSEF